MNKSKGNILLRMRKAKHSVYQEFLCTNPWLTSKISDGLEIYETWSTRYRKRSKNSFCFGDTESTECTSLDKNGKCEWSFRQIVAAFELGELDQQRLHSMFMQATNGSGNEWRKINILHSSSLLCFLCFATADIINNGIPIDINGVRKIFHVKRFEQQNNLSARSSTPSNIDVCLECVDPGNECILFLESKFTEYTSTSKLSSEYISPSAYKHHYTKIFNTPFLRKGSGMSFVDNVSRAGKPSLCIKSAQKHYLNGLKQIISHWLGAQFEQNNGQFKGGNVFLGEILLDFNCEDRSSGSKYFNDYENIYSLTAQALNSLAENVHVLPHILSYHDIFSQLELPPSVAQFYTIHA